MCGHGSGGVPFHVLLPCPPLTVRWIEALHPALLWQAVHRAEPELFITRNFPYWSSCGSWQVVHWSCRSSSSRTGPVSVDGLFSSPFAAASPGSNGKETGWSSTRSVPSRAGPAGIPVTPPCIGIGAPRLRTDPSATVPSWQERHSLDAPVGWPGRDLAVVLP